MTASYASMLAGTTATGLFSWRGTPERDLAAEAEAAGWLALRLDTRHIGSTGDFYAEVAGQWSLPAWFGRNLDALFDVLADLSAGPTVLVWDGLVRLGDVDPEQASAVVDVLRDAVGQSVALAVVVRDDLGVNGFDGLL
ncbi:barstar family protein [Aeromicrobium stalagmiti]|uniref:barstar family protein n=1 Tax=Aeromicrobium stalagmiti TaxID=2738988 RepID=UPI001C2C332A|nr:barstar family protein [Aeromicrobium stalagmiti]